MSTWAQINFQDSLSPLMEELNYLHDYINLILVFIISFVGLILLFMMNNSLVNQKLVEMQMVEWVWTVIPAALLLQIALPSLLLLYLLDEVADVELTVKAIGHQWYWSYEYSDFFNSSEFNLSFDSYMTPTGDLEKGGFRLLDVDNRTCLPYQTQIRLVISSDDVLHSWTVPSLGVKADAVPGRLNQMKFISHRPGLFFGQCSEICGANHSFMPIAVEMLDNSTFFNWVVSS